ncbi:MAG TPA: hypothetical protein GXX54_05175 [Clostridiales bacterium]|nr:hypothetical protein [Clostridiales bacterium]
MTEYRARNISLIIIALEVILLFLMIRTFFGYQINEVKIEGINPRPELIFFLLVFAGLGILIILSAFFKPLFYFLLVLQIAFSVYLLYSSRYLSGVLIFGLLAMMPPVLYLTAKTIIRFKT